MFLQESSRIANDLRRNALRFADEVSDRGRDVADRGRTAFNRITSNRPDPLDELRTVASFAVGAAALFGVGYLITRVVASRREQSRDRARIDQRGHRSSGSGSTYNKKEEPLHELLARLDSPEAIERHNDLVRQMHENARPSSRERATELATH